nr:TRAP transporter substrate-binding protein [Sedimentibacter sp.]
MKFKKLASVILVGSMLLSSVGCSSGNDVPEQKPEGNAGSVPTEASEASVFKDGPSFNIQLAHATSEGQAGDRNCVLFKKLVEERSEGKITVDIYPNGQLGTDRELFESTQIGDIQMCWQTAAPHVGFVPEVGILDLPSMFDNLDVAYKVLEEGEFREALEKAYNNAGIELINIFPYAFREMSSNKKVEKFEDFKGINIRTMDNQFHMAYWKALGANPTPLAFGELYIALQQGLLDAQENPLDTIVANKLGEQQKYIIKTNHVLFPSVFAMNKDYYDSMPKEYQQLVKSTMNEAAKTIFDEGKETEKESEETLKTINGCEIIELSPEVLEQMKEVAKPVQEMIYNAVGEEIATAFKNKLAEVQNSSN